MPNLHSPVTHLDAAIAYRARIMSAAVSETPFEPMMTLYLTDDTTPDAIQTAAKHTDIILGFKLYPAHATTHSAAGVHHLHALYPTFEAMEKWDVPLLVHGESTDTTVDVFDREAVFIEQQLAPLQRTFPALRIVLEHVSSKIGVDWVQAGGRVGATITPHHLLLTRNDLLVGGLHPHHYCLPVVKTASDRQALIQAAISGNPRFFLGTDSAPHTRLRKCADCGAAGIYSAPFALEYYAMVFEAQAALDRLEAFASQHGADFYGRPYNTHVVRLTRTDQTIPESLPFMDDVVIPLLAGQPLPWQMTWETA